jgi:heptosyltransferase-2
LDKCKAARACARNAFDTAILLQNAFEAAAIAYLAGIPERIGYARDGRGFLLTRSIPVPLSAKFPSREFLLPGTAAPTPGSWRAYACQRKSFAWKALRAARAAGWNELGSFGLGDIVIGVSPGAATGTA